VDEDDDVGKKKEDDDDDDKEKRDVKDVQTCSQLKNFVRFKAGHQ